VCSSDLKLIAGGIQEADAIVLPPLH